LPCACAAMVVVAIVGANTQAGGNAQESSTPRISPVFEGWEQNADGTYSMFFGYFNTNWDDAIDADLGANNTFEPGGPDRGQPTHFLPRRNWFVFTVQVP